MKDKNWTDIVSKQGDLRHFASMAIRKSGKSEHTSAQEIDFLFRIALSEEPLTPRQITNAMGISKTIVSRLTDHLESKGFICKEASASDRRSYCIRITGAGKDEIDRISTDTEYNSKTLLDGSLDTRVYTKNATRVDISDHVKAGQYQLSIDTAATQAGPVTANRNYNSTAPIGVSGTMSINGSKVEIEATDTYAEAFGKIRNAAETGETTVKIETNGALSFTAEQYGMSSILEIAFDDKQLANALGFTAAGGNSVVEDPENKGSYVYGQIQNGKVIVPSGTDAEVTLTKPGDGTGFGDTATVKTDGNKITVTDRAGFEMSFLADAGYTGDLDFDVTDIGTMALHIGANEDQETRVRIPEVSCKSLYIDDADVTTVNGAGRGITQFDDAISKVSEVRSRLGAYQNRLESTVSSLDTFEENMTGAQSRLTDADMASEMTDYTHQNVLNQAAISVLTQANDLPQQVLQILQ